MKKLAMLAITSTLLAACGTSSIPQDASGDDNGRKLATDLYYKLQSSKNPEETLKSLTDEEKAILPSIYKVTNVSTVETPSIKALANTCSSKTSEFAGKNYLGLTLYTLKQTVFYCTDGSIVTSASKTAAPQSYVPFVSFKGYTGGGVFGVKTAQATAITSAHFVAGALDVEPFNYYPEVRTIVP